MRLVRRIRARARKQARTRRTTHAYTRAAGRAHVTRTWVVRICAQMSTSGRSLDGSALEYMYGKEKSSITFEAILGAGGGGRTMFWASFLYGRARHKIDERL